MLEKLKRFNWLMFVAMLALVALGTAAIYSAGNARTEEVFHSMWKANLSTAVFGLAIYFVLAFFDYRRYLNLLAAPSYLFSLVLLVTVLFVGTSTYGGRRWLWFFQPSEVAKLCVIAALAWIYGYADERPWLRKFYGFLVAPRPTSAVPVLPATETATPSPARCPVPPSTTILMPSLMTARFCAENGSSMHSTGESPLSRGLVRKPVPIAPASRAI